MLVKINNLFNKYTKEKGALVFKANAQILEVKIENSYVIGSLFWVLSC